MSSILEASDRAATVASADRIVIGTTTPLVRPGGIPSLLNRLMREPDYAGVTYLAWSDPSESNVTTLGRFSRGRLLRWIVSQWIVLQHCFRAGILEVHSSRTGFVAMLLFPHKVTFYYHGPAFQEGAVEGAPALTLLIKYGLEVVLLRRIPRFLVASRAYGKRLIENYGIDPTAVTVRRPSLQFSRSQLHVSLAEKLRRTEQVGGKLQVLLIRRLVRRVGILEFLDALSAPRHRALDVTVHLVGEGPIEAEVRALAARDHRIVVHGRLSERQVEALCRDCLFSVVPSSHLEGLGMVIYEAVERDLVPLALDCDGIAELIDELGFGIVARDLPELIDHLSLDMAAAAIQVLR